jgi:uncharacterized protein YdhG (YjbR/CyaY superfamily)
MAPNRGGACRARRSGTQVFKNDLAPYEVSGKGTIRFPLSEPIPVKLIEGIAKFRAREVLEHRRLRGQQPKSADYCSAGRLGM